MTESAERLLQLHEGLKLFPYVCPGGRMTIGFGRNLTDKGITKPEAEYLLRGDIAVAVGSLQVDPRSRDIYTELVTGGQVVLVDMAVNLGFEGLMAFKRMWAALAKGDHEEAAAQILESRYALQVPARAEENAGIMRNPETLPELLDQH